MNELTKEQWELIKPLVSVKKVTRGRPRTNMKPVINGIFWICKTGSPCSDLPKRYPPYSTCFRLYKEMLENGVWDKVLYTIAMDLMERTGYDLLSLFSNKKLDPSADKQNLFMYLDQEKNGRTWVWNTLLVFLNPNPGEKNTRNNKPDESENTHSGKSDVFEMGPADSDLRSAV